MGVQEVSDGSAQTMLTELDRQLTHLRNMATELEIPNATKINWTLIVSSTSDGAATQTKFNKLLQGGMKIFLGLLTIQLQKCYKTSVGCTWVLTYERLKMMEFMNTTRALLQTLLSMTPLD